MNKFSQSLLAGIFLLLIGVLFITNIDNFFTIFNAETNANKIYEIDYSNIEASFRDKMEFHDTLTNVYGVFQKAIDHTVVGNFEYIADDDGVLHMVNDYSPYQTDHFVNELLKLKNYVEEKSVPIVYVQVPNREISCTNQAINDFNIDDESANYIVDELNKRNFSVLDIRDRLKDESVYKPFNIKDLFFHTDLHLQTDAEIWMASQVAEYLQNELNLNVDNKEYLTDMNNYSKKSYEFIGNYGRTYGDYFVKGDTFDIYHPLFPTYCHSEIPGASPVVREGSFEEAVLNGYEEKPYDNHTYWVTNYGQTTLPYYKYKNLNNPDGLKILVVADSTSYRAWSYLLLTVGEVTVLDPRYFDGTDYIRIAMEDVHYDTVLVWQETFLHWTTLVK